MCMMIDNKIYTDIKEIKSDAIDISKLLPPCGNTDAFESSGSNPFDKDSWNMAAQSKIYKENPEIAKYLAAAARGKL